MVLLPITQNPKCFLMSAVLDGGGRLEAVPMLHDLKQHCPCRTQCPATVSMASDYDDEEEWLCLCTLLNATSGWFALTVCMFVKERNVARPKCTCINIGFEWPCYELASSRVPGRSDEMEWNRGRESKRLLRCGWQHKHQRNLFHAYHFSIKVHSCMSTHYVQWYFESWNVSRKPTFLDISFHFQKPYHVMPFVKLFKRFATLGFILQYLVSIVYFSFWNARFNLE